MGTVRLERINLILERNKLTELRRAYGARNNSEAVRVAIDQQLAIKGIQAALRGLRELGTLEDVFHRAPARRTGRR
jgi:hypothetical protein